MHEEIITLGRPRDRYDQEIERLTKNCLDEIEFNNRIQHAWSASWTDGRSAANSPLFAYVTPDRFSANNPDGKQCGCVTQIRNAHSGLQIGSGYYNAWTPELTTKIGQDVLLPWNPEEIKPHDLHHIAEVQRMIDRELNREPLPLLPEPVTPYSG